MTGTTASAFSGPASLNGIAARVGLEFPHPILVEPAEPHRSIARPQIAARTRPPSCWHERRSATTAAIVAGRDHGCRRAVAVGASHHVRQQPEHENPERHRHRRRLARHPEDRCHRKADQGAAQQTDRQPITVPLRVNSNSTSTTHHQITGMLPTMPCSARMWRNQFCALSVVSARSPL